VQNRPRAKDVPLVSHEELLKILDYNPESGKFTWCCFKGPKAPAGSSAGVIDRATGYYVITINYRIYRAHRLAWFYMKGEWPSIIDHIDSDRKNNKWNNLRLATTSQNAQNVGLTRRNKSGLKGAFWHKLEKTWVSAIRVNNKPIWLGTFGTAEEAHEAYCAAADKYFGEFARKE
jgi:hypothetical protein